MDEQTAQEETEDKLKQCIDNLMDKRYVYSDYRCVCGGYSLLHRPFVFVVEVPRPVWQAWCLCDRLSPPDCFMTSCQRDGSPSVTALKDASKKVRPCTGDTHPLKMFESVFQKKRK